MILGKITTKEIVAIIKQVGSRGIVLETDVEFFLPSIPKLNGREPIFAIGPDIAYYCIDSEVRDLVTGLHLIELKYREVTGYDFGFGPPSATACIISALEDSDPDTATELSMWVARNGGNYYIQR